MKGARHAFAPDFGLGPCRPLAIVPSSPVTALQDLLQEYRTVAITNREAGTYFEELTVAYFKNEPAYRELYRDVVPYATWAAAEGLSKQDAGIDLVAETVTGEVHAIQCKLYPATYKVQKSDIDSFFTASGKKPFALRIIVSTTDLWSDHAEGALLDQQPPAIKIDLAALEGSLLDWSKFKPKNAPALRAKKEARPHQRSACEKVLAGLKTRDRGKLIMACGTGKTYTSLKIAEELAGQDGRVLFLVPSLALLSQSLTEWTQESSLRLQSFAVCSDSDVGKKRTKDDDTVQTFVHELQYPATTDPKRLATEVKKRHDAEHMSVVFATYQSIEVIHRAQKEHGLAAFDLIVCDEAHRTTGAKFEGEDESQFVKVHDAAYIHGTKRIYMTATPRIFGGSAKATAERDNVVLCSMDDEALYGPNLDVLTFSEAVKRGLLVDYKVVVLAVEEKHVSRRLQNLLKDENNELRVDDAAKIVGCWKALAKKGLVEELAGDNAPMKRAVAFCQVIERQKGAKVHKVSSKHIAEMFQAVVEAYQASETEEEAGTDVALRCEAAHVDGSMNASQKEAKIAWLKAGTDDDTCRILSNVRCLSEGVDVPALDAVLFLTPRSSQVDVVQSVGRVMRNAPGKKRGYIVLPVVIPAGVEAHVALDKNDPYKVVWQVLQALRSHDDRFDAMVNKLEFDARDPAKMEVIAVTDKLSKRSKPKTGEGKKKDAAKQTAKGGRSIGAAQKPPKPDQKEIEFEIGEIERAIYAKLVQKVGNRHHWEDWAKDIAKIARTHIDRISGILENPANVNEREAFDHFAEELRDDLNDSITQEEIVEMLAQHLVTKPVFDALFSGQSFARENSMSRAMQGVLDALHEHHLEKESTTLEAFYESVKLRASGIDSAEGKQKIVVELYDKFFQNAFPKLSERLGIVYTPVEIVDFILHSVDHLLRTEFAQTLGSDGVHILDPFTGTGTFITRLLQSGLISKDELPRKYAKEIHANEIVLLAYYIAAINIEAAYHGIAGGKYTPFEGICLTDTFQLYEKEDLVSKVLTDNSARRKRQKKLDIRVIIGNPPYSVGQDNDNDNNENVKYPLLDQRIAQTYVARSAASSVSKIYDSYIRAIRWATDRVGDSGIVGFVTNGGFVDAAAANGLRQCLADEFSSLYIFHLRGNQRTVGETSKREGGKIFESGSRAPVAISLLVKNPAAKARGTIFFRDVGDYLSRDEKLAQIDSLHSVGGITSAAGWRIIKPDSHGDWLRQRDQGFRHFMALGDKSGANAALFETYSLGLNTNRDAWVFSPSRTDVARNVAATAQVYNSELELFDADHAGRGKQARLDAMDGVVTADPTKISWSSSLRDHFARGTRIRFEPRHIIFSLYRPFSKQWVYFGPHLIHRPGQMRRIFPTTEVTNRVINVSCLEGGSFSALMSDVLPSKFVGESITQWFPLYVYGSQDPAEDELLSLDAVATTKAASGRRDGITDAGLTHFRSAYPDEEISKEDLFYYIYGVLHSRDYRERYADNLGKEIPRIPRVKTAADFWAFSKAGRALGEIHVGYEKVPEYKARIEETATRGPEHYRVEKMKFGQGKDKTVIRYNDFITVREIPLEAYYYVVNGKPAIDWVMERQSVTTDKDSGIVKDANAWATDTVGDPRYPLSLLLRVITVSLETIKLVKGLPRLDIFDETEPQGGDAKLLPFRRVVPKPGDHYTTCVPLIEIHVAAGSWGDIQEGVPELDDPSVEWVAPTGAKHLAKGMFVGRVNGKSMEPAIPDGAHCLFRRVSLPSSPARPVLVRHAGPTDPDTGGQYTIKLYRPEQGPDGVDRVVLQPANASFKPLILTVTDLDDVRVIAEVVEVLRP